MIHNFWIRGSKFLKISFLWSEYYCEFNKKINFGKFLFLRVDIPKHSFEISFGISWKFNCDRKQLYFSKFSIFVLNQPIRAVRPVPILNQDRNRFEVTFELSQKMIQVYVTLKICNFNRISTDQKRFNQVKMRTILILAPSKWFKFIQSKII